MESNISDRIRILMHFKKLTATQFAEIINVQRSSVSHILSGRNKPSLDFIQKIVMEFPEVSFEWLINGKGKLNKEKNDSHSNTVIEKESNLVTDVTKLNTHLSNEKKADILNIENTSPIEKSESVETIEQKTSSKNSDQKTIKRIVVFYNDGTFENYENLP